MADFDPSWSQNPEPILGMVDYLWEPTPQHNFGGGSATWVILANTVCPEKDAKCFL